MPTVTTPIAPDAGWRGRSRSDHSQLGTRSCARVLQLRRISQQKNRASHGIGAAGAQHARPPAIGERGGSRQARPWVSGFRLEALNPQAAQPGPGHAGGSRQRATVPSVLSVWSDAVKRCSAVCARSVSQTPNAVRCARERAGARSGEQVGGAGVHCRRGLHCRRGRGRKIQAGKRMCPRRPHENSKSCSVVRAQMQLLAQSQCWVARAPGLHARREKGRLVSGRARQRCEGMQ